MLAPLDGIEIDTLLYQLPKGTQLSQKADSLLNSLENIVNFGLGREATNTKSNAAMRTFVAVSKGSEDVARFEGCRSARTA